MRCAALVLLLTVPVFGWHPVGHKIIAAICYDDLPSVTRVKVDDLIRRHPDYASWTAGLTGNVTEATRARWAFINAAAWSDDIKGDPRFYDDTHRDAVATPTLAGYPDMRRHTNWHYVDFNFSPDGTAFPDAPPRPNLLTQMPLVLDGLKGQSGAEFAPYYLGWFLHLAGDIHQPLHATARWVAWNKDRDGRPQGDAGGNGVNVDGFTNLHAVWDDLLGTTDDQDYIDWMARRVRKEFAPEATPELSVEAWTKASFELAKTNVYQFPAEVGSRDNPFRPTREYRHNGQALARKQAALAGRRMAALLAKQLQ